MADFSHFSSPACSSSDASLSREESRKRKCAGNDWKGEREDERPSAFPLFPSSTARLFLILIERSVTSRYHDSTISGWQQNQQRRQRKENDKN